MKKKHELERAKIIQDMKLGESELGEMRAMYEG